MEKKLSEDNTVKIDASQQQQFKKHRKQALELKEKRKQEREQLENAKIKEEEMMFTQTDSMSEVQTLKDMVKKLQRKCKQQAGELQDLSRESND